MSTSHTAREAHILRIAQNGVKLLQQNYKDPHFCTGSAWATLGMILQALGQELPTAPWNEAVTDDEVTRG